jgi:uncharacterized ferritin-like protein (DUF455 family)
VPDLWCSQDRATNGAALDALRFGLERVLDTAAVWLRTVADTRAKLQLGKVMWHAATGAYGIAQRLDELQDFGPVARPSSPAYVELTNAMVELTGDGERFAALHELMIPDLRAALAAQLAATRSISDSLSSWALQVAILHLDDALAEHAAMPAAPRAPVPAHLAALHAAAGGVAGPARATAVPDGEIALSYGARVDFPVREPGLEIVEPQAPILPRGPAFLHGIVFNIEVSATEICASMIVEHPDAPFELKLDLARQAYDEVRHAEALLARCYELGGKLGESPIDFRIWRVFRAAESLAEALMLQQRIGEGFGLDIGVLEQEKWSGELADERTARLFEYINSDETNHVALGNRWIRHLLDDDPAQIAALEAQARDKMSAMGFLRVAPRAWIEGRKLAGFTDDEIREYLAFAKRLASAKRDGFT